MKTPKMKMTLLLAALTTTAITSVAAGQAFAQQPLQVSTTSIQNTAAASVSLSVNGIPLPAEGTYIYQNGKQQWMLPLRAVVEPMGYDIAWNQDQRALELTKGNRWFQLQIGQDRYNIAKMNVTLGAAPELVEGKTYVPLSFISDVLQENVSKDSASISISQQEEVSHLTKQGTITSVTLDETGGRINLNGMQHGINLTITDETEIVDAQNQKLKASDLKPGMTIEATHQPIMTLSLPPMSGATKIVVKEAAPALGTSGTIQEIIKTDDGHTRIVINGEKRGEGYDVIALTLSKETRLISTQGNTVITPDQLSKGQIVHAFYGPLVTRSLPPIGTAVKVLVEPALPQD